MKSGKATRIDRIPPKISSLEVQHYTPNLTSSFPVAGIWVNFHKTSAEKVGQQRNHSALHGRQNPRSVDLEPTEALPT